MLKKKKEKYFTEEMGRNIFVFPPVMEGNSGLLNWKDKEKVRKGLLYTGIPLSNLQATYKKTFGKKSNINLK